MRRASIATSLTLAALLALAAPAVGAAAPAKVKVGKAHLATAPSGEPALLVPIAYPIEMAGRRVRLTLSLRRPGGETIRAWTVRPATHAGPLRSPERRKRFVFVHRVDVGDALGSGPSPAGRLHLTAVANLDADNDGKREFRSLAMGVQDVPARSGGALLCATPPKRRAGPGERVVVPLPLCNRDTRWKILERPSRGSVRIRDGGLVFSSARKFRGTVSIALAPRPRAGAGSSATPSGSLTPVQIAVGTAESPVVRALGDSVTAGFGYYEHGEPMELTSLLSCRPSEESYDDACSSNSKVRNNAVEGVEYSADYGLSNNVSWVAQWANAHGLTDFRNYAVSGSEPSDWFGKGQLAATAKQLVAEDPDYILLTMGANPLLSNMLFGIGNLGCGVWSDIFGGFRECVAEQFAEIKLRSNLRTLYANLVRETDAQIFVMQYHLSIPTSALYTATQIAEMGVLLNEEIAEVAKEVSTSRIVVVGPPHFDTGLDIAPVYPADYKCEGRFFSSWVDGRSVQATISQTVMGDLHPLEFCPGAKGSAPWVISGDTGIHPSAAGYAQMASQVPAPE